MENLILKEGPSIIEDLYKRNEADEENISKEFYSIYKQVRLHLFKNIKKNNSERDELILLEKTQKILDRFIFVCFCEDTGLLPERVFRKIMRVAKESFSFEENKIWKELKGLFRAINKGLASHGINAFNGSLFAEDPILDSLIISDEIFEELAEVTDYDFQSDLNVNILGHILEQSISDLEELRAEIKGEETDRKKEKRKKEGIYYTPEYITKYIVENAVGRWLEDRKKDLGIDELPELTNDDYLSIKATKKGLKFNKKIEAHIAFWKAYKEKLMSIKVLDPACGSGAFLNQAFDFLYREGQKVNKKLSKLRGGQRDIFDLDKYILQSNLYGVDLNKEPVEITKLSLWLKTANKYSRLTDLDDNIKCGNSLIDDPGIVGSKAFKWEEAFPGIMRLGGFDVVIGNPPWGAKLSANEISHITKNYTGLITGEIDTYIVFMFKNFDLINRNGIIGIIVPDTWQTIRRAYNLRKYIYNNFKLLDIHDRYKPFKDAKDTRSHTLILQKIKGPVYNFNVKVVDSNYRIIKGYSLGSSRLEDFSEWNLYISQEELDIFKKMKDKSEELGKLYYLKYGLRTGKNTEYLGCEDKNNLNLKVARGSHIQRYYFAKTSEYLLKKEGLPESYFIDECLKDKVIVQYVRTNSTDLKSRWLEATLIEEHDYVALNSTSFIYKRGSHSLKYLLTILSSYLMNYYYKAHYTDVNVKPIYLEKLPIPNIPVNHQGPFIEKASLILKLSKQFHERSDKFIHFIDSSYSPQKITKKLKEFFKLSFAEFASELRNQKVNLSKKNEFGLMDFFEEQKSKSMEIKETIDTTDKEIDRMVYELYGLTEEEIRIVEDP